MTKTFTAVGLTVAFALAPVAAFAKHHHHHHHHMHSMMKGKMMDKKAGNANPAGEGAPAAEQGNK